MRRARGARNSRAGALQRRRLAVLAAAGTLGYLGLTARAVQLQAIDADHLAGLAQSQRQATLQLDPLRGEIVDRHGTLLAVSADTESVAASPFTIGDRQRTARLLAEALDLPRARVYERLRATRHFAWIERWVTPDEADRIRRLDLAGVRLIAERKRFYPNGDLAAAYLGFAGHDGQGLSGLELAYETTLRGQAGSLNMLRGPRGRKLVHWDGDVPVRTGDRIVTTLDASLQHVAEAVLKDVMVRTRARRASLVALDPRNGDILALAERPGFDPNRFWLEDPATFHARSFTGLFEPGSTLKPFTIALALEAGAVRATDRFDCEQGRWRVADRVIHDAKPHGVLDVGDIVRLSSNIGAAKIAAQLGSQELVDGLRRFGFGATTGSGFPGEAAGILRRLRASQTVERANLAFGQGISVTATQLAAAGATLANGGRRVQPRLILRIEGDGASVTPVPVVVGARVISARTARQVLNMLREAVRNGTGRAAALPDIEVAGKTGTAQKVIDGRYSTTRMTASFLGILPASDPKLVVAVIVDEPQGLHTGGVVAAPAFREFAARASERLRLAWRGRSG